MFGPKQPGDYPDREIDCQEAISQGLADLVEQQVAAGATEAEATEALSGANVVGVRELIQDAVDAGWSEEEAATAIRIVSQGLHHGATGRDPDE